MSELKERKGDAKISGALSADMAKLAELNSALQDAKKAVAAHKAEITKHCEVKVGDEVVCNGYTHRGKTILIDRVWLHDMWGGNYQFRASGKIKKKNGELGTQVGEWHQVDGVARNGIC